MDNCVRFLCQKSRTEAQELHRMNGLGLGPSQSQNIFQQKVHAQIK